MSQFSSPIWRYLRKYGYQVGFWLVVMLAIFFRFYHLGQLPPGLSSGEAANSQDIFRLIDKHQFWPPYSTSGPRGFLLFYLQVISVLVFGNTIFALRVMPALAGVATVIVTYYLTKSWFGPRVALISAFLLSVTPWAVTLSRTSVPASLTPLLTSLTMWLFTKALQTKRQLWFILGGLCLGLGTYNDSSFRVLPLAFLIAYGYVWLRRREFTKNYSRQLAVGLVVFILSLAPMFIYGAKHQAEVRALPSHLGVFNSAVNGGHPLAFLANSSAKTILMFNLHGDDNYLHNLGGQPLLNFFVGLMFVTGIIVCLSQAWRPRYLATLAVLILVIISEIIIADSVPNAFRLAAGLPLVIVLAAMGVNYWLDIWYSTFPINSAARISGLLMISIPLAATLYQGYNQYFVAWAKSPETYQAYSEDAVAIANFMNSTPTKAARYTLTNDSSDQIISFLNHNHATYSHITTSSIAGLGGNTNAQFLIANNLKDESLKELKAKYPKARLVSHHSSFSGVELFNVYEVQP